MGCRGQVTSLVKRHGLQWSYGGRRLVVGGGGHHLSTCRRKTGTSREVQATGKPGRCQVLGEPGKLGFAFPEHSCLQTCGCHMPQVRMAKITARASAWNPTLSPHSGLRVKVDT